MDIMKYNVKPSIENGLVSSENGNGYHIMSYHAVVMSEI